MKLHVESWSPEYGSPVEGEVLAQSEADVDVAVELPAAAWRPLDADGAAAPADCIAFVDGVRRIDARVWITADDGTTRMGICASYAAGIARCEGAHACIDTVEVRRGLFAPAGAPDLATRAGTFHAMAVAGDDVEQLSLGLQERMGRLETAVATRLGAVDCADGAAQGAEDAAAPARAAGPFVVLDGPLTGRQNIPGAIGYVKTHRVAYLPESCSATVAALAPGQRTPLFVTQTSWSRYSWYLRLPYGGDAHPWAGVVRCEASADLPLDRVVRLADIAALTLPRFASAPHKDARAPQNLYPIAGLERELRRRLGDPAWVWRALRAAAA